MVILVKPNELRQTATTLFVSVPLPRNRGEVRPDVFSSKEYLKVSFRPYLLELFWSGDVNDEDEGACRVVIRDGGIFIEVDKSEEGTWDAITKEDLR